MVTDHFVHMNNQEGQIVLINLREARQKRGVTIQQLSLASDISDQTIRNVERDPDAQVSVRTARKLLAGISDLPLGTHSFESFVESVHGMFPERQIYEVLASDLDSAG